MQPSIPELFKKAYAAFNNRDIAAALETMHLDIEWPKAFEGGYVSGQDAIQEYWTRQWTEINPQVEPMSIAERPDGRFALTVHQLVKDLSGQVLFDGLVNHVYTLEDGLLRRMDIEA
ncbi:MAG: nuclear transport factor 2 family protein [Sphingobacteriales bacterium]|nr:MAG: nuclear transport factor 2 family protein [Sphingobacteriales bacterium]